MKLILCMIFGTILAGFTCVQPNSNTMDLNGWAFLEWGTEKSAVEAELAEREIAVTDPYGDAAYEHIIRFEYEEMETWLYFDESDHLLKANQYRYFSAHRKDDAQTFYDHINEVSETNFGEPASFNDDTQQELITKTWETESTKLTLTFDYEYKIIDEFGANSYKVNLLFEPI